MKTLRTLSIGDVHGVNDWMYWTHGSPEDFNYWAISVTNGAPADDDLWREEYDNYMSYDKIIFIGDYVDSFTVNNVQMKKVLEDIIFFKKALPDKVVLLLGNHDIQYFIENQICSGYRPEMKFDFYKLFTDNLSLFRMAYELGGTLWTHAGVTRGWLKELHKEMNDPKHHLHEVLKLAKDWTISQKINHAWECRLNSIYNVDKESGGWNMWAGPLWVRPKTLNENRISMKQIVGHTPMQKITVEDRVTYIDCLEHGDADCLDLEINISE
jgi:predicted MPP superfamily phosphohydrolase